METYFLEQTEKQNKAAVKALQRELNQGGASLKVDGVWGSKTQAAYEASYKSNASDAYSQGVGVIMAGIEPLLNAGSLNYTPRSTDSIRAQYEESLRPGLDLAIARRIERTKEHKADLDADSLSRGMGKSTFVSDMKKRLMDSEVRDIGQLESEYSALLAKLIMETAEKELSRSFEAEKFNLNLQTQATNRAFLSAEKAYITNTKQTSANTRKTSVTPTSAKNCYLFLEGLSPHERSVIYNGETAQGRRYRAELVESLGKSGYVAVQGIYPGG